MAAAGKDHGLYRHGMWNHPAYRSWQGAKDRCRSTSPKIFPHYGARGIRVCRAWAEDFVAFWTAMGDGWFQGTTLERIDNDKGYEPGNCRWAPKSEQPKNRRVVVHVETPWGVLSVADAARKIGMSPPAFGRRVLHGWTGDRLFSAPAEKGARVTPLTKAHLASLEGEVA